MRQGDELRHGGKRHRVEVAGGMKADARHIDRGDCRFEYPVDDATDRGSIREIIA